MQGKAFLKMDNFLSFAIVNGFFFGLILSFLKFDEPEMIVAATLISTVGFYLIVLAASSLFLHFYDFGKLQVQKSKHDAALDYFVSEFDRREKTTNKIRSFLRTMEATRDTEEEMEAPPPPKPVRKSRDDDDEL